MIDRADIPAASLISWKASLKLEITTVSVFIWLCASDGFCNWGRWGMAQEQGAPSIWVSFVSWITSKSYLKLSRTKSPKEKLW